MIEPNEATRGVSTSSRRSFLKRSAVGAGAVWYGVVAALSWCAARKVRRWRSDPYGPISPEE